MAGKNTIRVNNSPEYVSWKLLDWSRKQRIDIQYIQPSKPQKMPISSAKTEQFVMNGLINIFEEAQHQATKLLWTYNNERSNIDIGGITPAQKLKLAA